MTLTENVTSTTKIMKRKALSKSKINRKYKHKWFTRKIYLVHMVITKERGTM